MGRGPTDQPSDALTSEIADSLDRADPEVWLASVEERHLGTGALLRRLRACRDTSEACLVLEEPFRPDWALIRADHLRSPLPRAAVHALVHHGTCPDDAAFLLLHGRPPRPGEADETLRANTTRPRRPAPSTGSPPPDRGTGPLGSTAEDAGRVLRTLPMGATGELLWFHVENAIQRGLLTARETVEYGTDACSVIAWLGQTSALHQARTDPYSGIALAHREARTLLAGWCAQPPPPVGMWLTVRGMIRDFPGTLPALLREAGHTAV